jgi:hypothetical protein
VASFVSLLALASGCSVITDPGADEYRPTLEVDVTSGVSEPDTRYGFYVLDAANEAVHMGYLLGLPATGVVLRLPYVLERDESYSVGVFRDLDGNGVPAADESRFQASVEELADDPFATMIADVELDEPPFDDPTNQIGPLPFRMSLAEFQGPHSGQSFTVRVIDVTDSESPDPILTYRLDTVPTDETFEVFVPNVVEEGSQYRIEFFADRDLSGDYSGTAPDIDHSWVLEETAGPAGIDVAFTHLTPFDELEYFVLVD